MMYVIVSYFVIVVTVSQTVSCECSTVQVNLNTPTVLVKEGELQGVKKVSSLTGEPFYAFLGIPYAQPPIGHLRFKAPVPKEAWEEVYNAMEEPAMCMHINGRKSILVGSEDCLYLNVYTPEAPSESKRKRAVMVFIHGGGFHSESSVYYGANYLINYDVVLVTLNYRLHIFGFLNTGTPNCPGNAGLKDQLLALKWVKRNIINFGGDPENITLFGESAGAVSVHLQMLSPLSKGLFNRAILQSGTALSPWAIQPAPELDAWEIGHLAGYRGNDLEGLVTYLKDLTGEELTEFASQCKDRVRRESPGRCKAVVFTPSVETIKEGAFLPDFPENLMKLATPIPTIVGYNDQEGSLLYFAQSPKSIELLLDDISVLVQNNFDLNELERAELLAEIRAFYFNNEPITRTNIPELVNLYGDLLFMKFHEAFDHLTESIIPPYMYLFTYNGSLNIYKHLKLNGAAHADELAYLFSRHKKPMNEKDEEVIRHICTLWTDFAKTGHPTSSLSHVEWKPHTTQHPCYIRIGDSLEVFNEYLNKDRFNFWAKWSSKFLLNEMV